MRKYKICTIRNKEGAIVKLVFKFGKTFNSHALLILICYLGNISFKQSSKLAIDKSNRSELLNRCPN